MHNVPISPTSPWYHFRSEGIGSLAFREWMGETISAGDVQRVVDANSQSVADERLTSFVERVSISEIRPSKVKRGRRKGREVERIERGNARIAR